MIDSKISRPRIRLDCAESLGRLPSWSRRDFAAAMVIGAATLGTITARSESESSPLPTAPFKSRSQEAERLCRFAEKTHPDGATAALNPEWHRRADAFIEAADRFTEAQYPVEALRLLAWFKDGHTGVYVPALQGSEWSLRLPLVARNN